MALSGPAWHEVRMARGADVAEFYRALPRGSYVMFHHFWDEPWWPERYVIRVKGAEETALASYPGVDHVVPWDASEDEALYGAAWENVAVYFYTSSTLAGQSPRMAAKLVHCMLNARGMSELDEAKFAARFAWGRLTIRPRLWLRERRR